MSRRVRVGFIGCGGISQSHAQRLRDVPTIVPGSSIKLRAVPYDEDEGRGSDISLQLSTPGSE